jgi:hypothetical protein
MSIRHVLGAGAAVLAAMAVAAPAFAQKAEAKGAVIAPVADPVEAPEPDYNPTAVIDLGAFETCMTVYDQWELEDTEKADTAELETACTEAIKAHKGYERRAALSARADLRWKDGRKEEALKDYGTLIYLEPRNISIARAGPRSTANSSSMTSRAPTS